MFKRLFQQPMSRLLVVVFCLLLTSPLQFGVFLPSVFADRADEKTVSSGYHPTMLRGMTTHLDNPFRFEFIVENGDTGLSGEPLKREANQLLEYFCAALTVPEKDLWVNLSPTEKDRIIPEAFGKTAMGKVLLEQDYQLKQLTASLLNPNTPLGQKYWAQVKRSKDSQQRTTDHLIAKIWIMPQEAVVYESAGRALVIKSKLTVHFSDPSLSDFQELLLPEIEKHVNESQRFAPLRQVYHAVILSAWFKTNLQNHLLNHIYSDHNKVAGIDHVARHEQEEIYKQYLAALKQGAFQVIKEEMDEDTGEEIPRKYFSGGVELALTATHLAASPLKVIRQGDVGSQAGNGALYEVPMAFTTPAMPQVAAAPILVIPSEAYNFAQLGSLPQILENAQRSAQWYDQQLITPAGVLETSKGMMPRQYLNMIQNIVQRIRPPQNGTVYAPFGGLDPAAAFRIFQAEDVVSVGYEKFGRPKDLMNRLSSENVAMQRGYDYVQYLQGFDSSGEDEATLKIHHSSSVGWMAMGRIMSMLGGQILGLHYFEIDGSGAIQFLTRAGDVLKGDDAFKNAVIVFKDQNGQLHRFWYISHNYYLHDNQQVRAFGNFVSGLKFKALFLKATYDILDAIRPETRQILWNQILDPAERNNAFVISDRVGHNQPIWKNPNAIFLNPGEQLGYASAREPLFFGRATQIISQAQFLKSSSTPLFEFAPDLLVVHARYLQSSRELREQVLAFVQEVQQKFTDVETLLSTSSGGEITLKHDPVNMLEGLAADLVRLQSRHDEIAIAIKASLSSFLNYYLKAHPDQTQDDVKQKIGLEDTYFRQILKNHDRQSPRDVPSPETRAKLAKLLKSEISPDFLTPLGDMESQVDELLQWGKQLYLTQLALGIESTQLDPAEFHVPRYSSVHPFFWSGRYHISMKRMEDMTRKFKEQSRGRPFASVVVSLKEKRLLDLRRQLALQVGKHLSALRAKKGVSIEGLFRSEQQKRWGIQAAEYRLLETGQYRGFAEQRLLKVIKNIFNVNYSQIAQMSPSIAQTVQDIHLQEEGIESQYVQARKRLNSLIKQSGKARAQASRDLATSEQSLYNWTHGPTRLDKRALPELAKYFGFSVADVWPGEDLQIFIFPDTQKGQSPSASSQVGGINLDPSQLNLKIKRDANGIPSPVGDQPEFLQNIHGFVPVILEIKPIKTFFLTR